MAQYNYICICDIPGDRLTHRWDEEPSPKLPNPHRARSQRQSNSMPAYIEPYTADIVVIIVQNTELQVGNSSNRYRLPILRTRWLPTLRWLRRLARSESKFLFHYSRNLKRYSRL